MPIYVYQCPSCGAQYEKIRSAENRNEPVICGVCDHDVHCKRRYMATDFILKKRWEPTPNGWKWRDGQ